VTTNHAAHGVFASDRITVEVVGNGPDVVLIPGLGSSPEAWRSTVAAVPGYRYHLVQVKGFAGVAPGGNATGPVLVPVADEIARYIREQHLDHPAVVGHSMGGSLAMRVATQNPDIVGKLMVVDMMPFLGAMFAGPTATPQSVEPIAAQMRRGMIDATPEVYRAQATGAVTAMVRNEEHRARAIADSVASNQAVSGQSMYDLVTTNLIPDLPRFTGPFTVLWVVPAGVPLTQEQLAMAYRAAYAGAPQAVVTHIPDSAHFIMWDNPTRFQSELRSFLTSPR
jgi:pimeloyl-ACP methyl ester carboxylesterase